jgi:ComF family protein
MPRESLRMLLYIWNFILDTVVPQDPYIRSIEKMGPGEFMAAVKMLSPGEHIDGALCFFSYRDPLVKAAILEVKSYGNRIIARLLAKTVRELLIAELSDLELFKNFVSPVLLPIPLTRKSLQKRGWNQCGLIVDEIKKIDQEKLLEIRNGVLIKTRETGDQVGKSRKERLENLRMCFSVRSEDAVRGRNVIVLDDIATTGATLFEARRALKKAGAKKVLCVAIAH